MRSEQGYRACVERRQNRFQAVLGRYFALTLLVLTFPVLCIAQSMQVPSGSQAELMAKVAGYDRNFAARAGAKAVIILAAMPDDAESMRAALEVKGALARVPVVG